MVSPYIARNRQVKFNNANINERIRANLPIHFKVSGYDILNMGAYLLKKKT